MSVRVEDRPGIPAGDEADADPVATPCARTFRHAFKVKKNFFQLKTLIKFRFSTSRTKSVLEYVLWGPADVSINGPLREREVTLQRWLDLSRATALRSLAGNKIDLTIYDECHLIFLIRSNSKTMLDASQIIAANFNPGN